MSIQRFFSLSVLLGFLVSLLAPFQFVLAAEGFSLKGRILLQVEGKGEAWYVNPADGLRYYLANGEGAYAFMREKGVGISDADLNRIPAVARVADMRGAASVCATNGFANAQKGKILLQVQQRGEAWYVSPDTCRRVYMKDGEEAYAIMRQLSLGITNRDLDMVSTHPDYTVEMVRRRMIKYKIYPTTNEAQGFGIIQDMQEAPLDLVAVERDRVIAVVSQGYEDLGKAYVDQFVDCREAVSQDLGIGLVKEPLRIKVYVRTDGQSGGGLPDSTYGVIPIVFQSQADYNSHLSEARYRTGKFQNFMSNTSVVSSCVYSFIDSLGLSNFLYWGVNIYEQNKYKPFKNNIACLDDGYRKDSVVHSYDISDSQDLDSYYCFVKKLNDVYGHQKFQELMMSFLPHRDGGRLQAEHRLVTQQYPALVTKTDEYYTEAVQNHLLPVYGNSVKPLLDAFGISYENVKPGGLSLTSPL